MNSGNADLIVVGSGVAGLYAALSAATRDMSVTLVTKDALENSNSWYAQGGLTAVGPVGITRGDSVTSHIADTLVAGAQLNDVSAVRSMCESAWTHVEALVAAGTEFDRTTSGEFALGLEAAHAHPRILHAGGDATGKVMASALITACLKEEASGRLTIRERVFVTDLLQADPNDPQRVSGIRVLNQHDRVEILRSSAVLLATGGIGRLYAATTNPSGATGDGAALAYRAGAMLADTEFVQFHPTLVNPGGFMISEAVRGEGAILVDQHGERFMPSVHPDAELAPRDVVARAIHAINASGNQSFLDATAVEVKRGEGFLARRFPSITTSLAALGYDLAVDPVPVTEAAHYWMGGVLTNEQGQSTLPGLYAAGETACTGVHGANRLASNSLLEALTFAWNTVVSLEASNNARTPDADISVINTRPGTSMCSGKPAQELTLEALQNVATTYLGVERTATGLHEALGLLASYTVSGTDRAAHELRNLLTLATVIANAALNRTNSIGAHYRLDAPAPPELNHGKLARYGFKRAPGAASMESDAAAHPELQTSRIG